MERRALQQKNGKKREPRVLSKIRLRKAGGA